MVSLLELSDSGRNDAELLEKEINRTFSDEGSIPLDVEDFNMKLVYCTF